MRSYDKNNQSKSHAMQPNPKHEGKQASIETILQRYATHTLTGKEVGVIQQNSLEDEEETIQQKAENKTGLPDDLKTGIENLSGYSMDDVKVHYNSDKPAQLNALAYAQGTDIHVGPGQEKYLPHEAWHVVQQKQGRVQPIIQMQGAQVNNDEGLEKEADAIGKVAQHKNKNNNKMNSEKEGSCIQCLIHPSKVNTQTFIQERAFEGTATNNIVACANAFTNHNGRTSGGGTNHTHQGHTVFHHSVGARDQNDGCTIFFICTINGDFVASPSNSGQIIAIGRHRNNNSYNLNWVAQGVTFGNNIQL